MHHEVVAPEAGRVDEVLVEIGMAVMPGDVLARLVVGRGARAPSSTRSGAEPRSRPT